MMKQAALRRSIATVLVASTNEFQPLVIPYPTVLEYPRSHSLHRLGSGLFTPEDIRPYGQVIPYLPISIGRLHVYTVRDRD